MYLILNYIIIQLKAFIGKLLTNDICTLNSSRYTIVRKCSTQVHEKIKLNDILKNKNKNDGFIVRFISFTKQIKFIKSF